MILTDAEIDTALATAPHGSVERVLMLLLDEQEQDYAAVDQLGLRASTVARRHRCAPSTN